MTSVSPVPLGKLDVDYKGIEELATRNERTLTLSLFSDKSTYQPNVEQYHKRSHLPTISEL